MGKDGRTTRAKIVITTDHDCWSASWIKKELYIHVQNARTLPQLCKVFVNTCGSKENKAVFPYLWGNYQMT